MATLTEASIIARKSLRYFIYSIIAIVVLRSLILTAIAIYKKVFPAPPPPPTILFGKLTKLPFPETTKRNLQFTLETPDGAVPALGDQAKVYFMPKTSANLLSLDFAKEKAARLGFTSEPQQISDSLYRFFHKSAPQTMEIDIITGAFSTSFDLNLDREVLAVKPPLPEIAASAVRSYLSSAGLLPDDLTGKVEHKYLKTQSGGFIPALSLSDGNIVRIDLFRKNLDEKPVVSKNFSQSNVWFMVSGLREGGRDVIAGEYHYFPVDESQFSTYPIKSSETAWQELVSGNYYPASYGTTVDEENVKIRRIYLAYYDAGVYTEFMQPVFVFEGDKDFVAYIPAVTNDYYGE